MTLQSTVALNQGFGVVGELAFDGPLRAISAVIDHATAANIVVGRWFTAPADGEYRPGGTGAVGGLLVNPKVYASIGTSAGGPLAPTLIVPTGTVGEFASMGEFVVAAANAVALGDLAMYDTTTGAISALSPTATYTGVIAITTGILTVSAASADANLAVGSPVIGTGVPGGTFITALGTGTGGNGTYQTNIITAVASFTDGVAPNNAPAGSAIIPGAKFIRYANAAAGLAVLSLTA